MTCESYIQNLFKTFQKFEVTRAFSELLKAQDGPSHPLGDNSLFIHGLLIVWHKQR